MSIGFKLRTFSSSVTLASALATLVAPTLALAEQNSAAQQSPPANASPAQNTQAGVRAHDDFFLNVQIPVGHRNHVASLDGDDLQLSGFGAGFVLMLGGEVASDLIVVGELGALSLPSAELSLNGVESESEDFSVTLSQFGAGVVYYLMPANVYVGASLLLSRSSLQFDGDDVARTKLGMGAALRAGKEFWVGEQWALGAGIEARGASMVDEAGADVLAGGLSLALGVTYD
jgi:hypothetical protein